MNQVPARYQRDPALIANWWVSWAVESLFCAMIAYMTVTGLGVQAGVCITAAWVVILTGMRARRHL